MPDSNKLKATLQKAAKEGEDVGASTPQAILKRLVDEIDATVLPRDLLLDNGANHILSLTVKSRRLLRVNAPVPRALGALPGVVDAELGQQPDQMTALAHLLAAFAAQTKMLSVSVTEPARPEVLNELGIAADQLSTAIEESGYALRPAPPNLMDALTEIANAHGQAWAQLAATEVVASGGDIAQLERTIEDALPYLLKTERRQSEQAMTWVFGSDGAARTVITVQRDACLVAKLPADQVQSWIKACAPQEAR